MLTKPKYITNKELLHEIHKSKKSYCYYIEDKYSDYDNIAPSVDAITVELAEEVLAKKNSKTRKDPKAVVKTSIDELVFRVMTYEHVPLCDDKKKRSRTEAGQGHLRTNFPPFKHYILRDGVAQEVGRSHWRYGLDNGVFSGDHGKITNRLAQMFLLLVERYSRRGNWRGYCVSDDTEALTQRGWLSHNDINEQDTVLSYNGERLAWSGLKSIFRDDFDGKMFHLTVRGMDALVTPGHKFVTQDGLKPVELLLAKDRVILSADAVSGPIAPKYNDAFVELVGWTITEGNFYKDASRTYNRVTIFQNEGEYAQRIRNCLSALGSSYGESTTKKCIAFSLPKKISDDLSDVIEIDGRVPRMDFILSLSENQRELLINTMIDADGYRSTHVGYTQKSRNHMDAFVALCTLAGYRTSVSSRSIVSFGKPTDILNCVLFSDRAKHSKVENIDFHGGKKKGSGLTKLDHQNEPTVDYAGLVWCPETEYGSFMCRRNGKVFLTGNTYNEDMRGTALLQLSQVGLVFDESKGDNPFAFYTTTIKNCLGGDTMVLTKEFGSVPISDISEQDVTLLDGNGDWVKCHIHDHGVQETQLNYFQSGGQKIGVWSTLNHGWISNGARVETEQFAGHEVHVDDLRPLKNINDSEQYRQGVIHGLVYGDGNFQYVNKSTEMNIFKFRLCSQHDSLEQWFAEFKVSHPVSYKGDPHYRIESKLNLKKFPENPGSNPDYLLGFVRGWFAADGCVSTVPTPTLCGDESEFNWLKKWGPLVGWHLNNFTVLSDTTNFGKRKKRSVNMHLVKSTMDADDFLIEKHRLRWATRPQVRPVADRGRKYDWNLIEQLKKQGKTWEEIASSLNFDRNQLKGAYNTRSMRQNNKQNASRDWVVYGSRQPDMRRMERVFCPVVDTTGSFALASGIHSSNCFTRVVIVERKNQNIRDDLLTMAGARPSYTRQIENELAHKFADQGTAKPMVKRGRKAKTATPVPVENDDE